MDERLVAALRNCAAAVRATPAQCVAALAAVSARIAPPYSALDDRRAEAGDAVFAKMAAQAHALSSLAAVMRTHAGDSRVQAAGCDLIFRLLQAASAADSDCVLHSPDLPAAVDALLAAAAAHSDLLTHIHACEAIKELFEIQERYPCDFYRASLLGACDGLCAGRSSHAASLENNQNFRIEIYGPLVLGYLCRLVGVHAGALAVASAELRKYGKPQCSSVAFHMLMNMTCCCVDDESAMLQIIDSSCADVVAAMRHELAKFEPCVQLLGIHTLTGFIRSATATARLCAEGAIEAAVDALRTFHPLCGLENCSDVEKLAWPLLQALTGYDNAHAQRAIGVGVLELSPPSEPEANATRTELVGRLRALQQHNAAVPETEWQTARQHAADEEQATKVAAAMMEYPRLQAEADENAQAAMRHAVTAAETEAVRRADAAMAALLAEEEAERAQAGVTPSRKAKKRSKAATRGTGATTSTTSAPLGGEDDERLECSADTAAELGDAAGAVAPAAAIVQPSASAARRHRRAAAKAAARQSGGSTAAAIPLLGVGNPAAQAYDAISGALQSAHISRPPLPLPSAAAAVTAAAHAHTTASLQATLAAQATTLNELETRVACPICLDATRCTALLPCKHLALCAAPACLSMLGVPPRCPLCRAIVTDTMQLFV